MYAVPPDPESADLSHLVYTKSTLAVQTMPAALALTDVSRCLSAVSFEDLDLEANLLGGDLS